jgi:hypothetical protein
VCAGASAKETANINRSLFCLGKVRWDIMDAVTVISIITVMTVISIITVISVIKLLKS